MYKSIITFGIMAVALSGCAEWQAYTKGIDAAGTQMVQNVNDDALAVEVQGLCAQPYSSLVRNAGKIGGLPTAIQKLCGPIPLPADEGILSQGTAPVVLSPLTLP